mgnify:CR=1 FL=1|jgi:hypothetical protein
MHKRKIDDITNESDDIVQSIISYRSSLYEIMYNLENEKNKIRELLNKLDKKLYKICKHNWIIDTSEYDPCRTLKICSICNCNR